MLALLAGSTERRPPERQPERSVTIPFSDLSGSAHWRNKSDAGLVVYRDFDAGQTLVLSRKIRQQPICGVQGAVTFVFNPVARRYEDVEGSFRVRGRRR